MLVNKKYKTIKCCHIYELVCRKTGMRYIGNTIIGLTKRLNNHRCTRNCASRQIIENGNYFINELETIYIRYKLSALLKEQWYINNLENINQRPALNLFRRKKRDKKSLSQYREKNREILRIKGNTYYSKIKDIRNKNFRDKIPIQCECGGRYKSHRKRLHERTTIHKKYLDNIINETNSS